MSKVACPHCRNHLELEGSGAWAGDQVACPVCGGHFLIGGNVAAMGNFESQGFSPPPATQRRPPSGLGMASTVVGLTGLLFAAVWAILAMTVFGIASAAPSLIAWYLMFANLFWSVLGLSLGITSTMQHDRDGTAGRIGIFVNLLQIVIVLAVAGIAALVRKKAGY